MNRTCLYFLLLLLCAAVPAGVCAADHTVFGKKTEKHDQAKYDRATAGEKKDIKSKHHGKELKNKHKDKHKDKKTKKTHNKHGKGDATKKHHNKR